jgi:hypothetical protein
MIKKEALKSAIRCMRIDYNLFRFGFVSKSDGYLGNNL